MIKIRCKECKQLFEIDLVHGKGRIPIYCKNCKKTGNDYISTLKQTLKYKPFDKKLLSEEQKQKMKQFWIIDDINMPHCSNCKTNITFERDEQKLSNDDMYKIYYEGKKDYELRNIKTDRQQFNDDNIIYDYNHGIVLCKKCMLVIGHLEVPDYESDFWNI